MRTIGTNSYWKGDLYIFGISEYGDRGWGHRSPEADFFSIFSILGTPKNGSYTIKIFVNFYPSCLSRHRGGARSLLGLEISNILYDIPLKKSKISNPIEPHREKMFDG